MTDTSYITNKDQDIISRYKIMLDNLGVKENQRDRKTELFKRKVDYLTAYYKAVWQSGETVTPDQKKNILLMYKGIYEDMNLLNQKMADMIAPAYLDKMKAEIKLLKDTDPQRMKSKVNPVYEREPDDLVQQLEQDNIQKEISILQQLYDATLISNKKIYGRSSGEFDTMQKELHIALLAAKDVLKAYQLKKTSPEWSAKTEAQNKNLYKDTMTALKKSAGKYLMTKLVKTHYGQKANARERARIELADLVMKTANGLNRGEIQELIPGSLINKAENHEVKEQAVLLCC